MSHVPRGTAPRSAGWTAWAYPPLKEHDIPVVYQADAAAGGEAPSARLRPNVADDLEAIFAPLGHRASAPSETILAGQAPTTPLPQAPRRRNGTILALILVTLLGATVVALASWWQAAPVRVAARAPASPGRAQSRTPAPLANPRPDPTDIGTAPALDDIPDATAGPLAQGRPSNTAHLPAPALVLTPAPHPDRVTPPTTFSPAPADAQPMASVPPSVAAAAAPVPPVVIPAPELARACEPGATESWCLRTPVAEADAALRGAYAAAVAAGVKRSVLGEVRADWSRLRRTALSDPQTVLRGYTALTEQLRLETRQARP